MKKTLFHILYRLRVYPAFPSAPLGSAVILTYHGFTDKNTRNGIENHQGKHVLIEKFEKQIQFLKKNYHLLSLQEWVRSCRESKKMPKRSVILTLDDGYRSNYTLAFPVLKKYDVPATVFVSTAFVEERVPLWPDRLEYALNKGPARSGNPFEFETGFRLQLKQMPPGQRLRAVEEIENQSGRRLDFREETPAIYQPLQWSEVLEMLKSGLVTIGSHTHTHPILTRCSPEDMKTELQFSKNIIEKQTGEPCRLFCYPNGGPGDFNAATKSLLQATGYECGLTTAEGFNTPRTDFYELKRMGVRNQTDDAEFAMTVCGFKHAMSEIRGFFGRTL